MFVVLVCVCFLNMLPYLSGCQGARALFFSHNPEQTARDVDDVIRMPSVRVDADS